LFLLLGLLLLLLLLPLAAAFELVLIQISNRIADDGVIRLVFNA
jgi:hypothetical protein|tara:strand:- start:301 stop:432 length:132 start_codon:yes stop_codon:yes gene_type:complete